MFIRKSPIVLSIALAALTCFASSAFARTVPARVGGPYEGTDTCFKDFEAGMKNQCATSRWYDIGLVFDTGGTKVISVYGSSMTTCYFSQVTPGGSVTPAALLLTPVTGGHHRSLLAPLTAGNFAKVQCLVPPGASIYGVDHTT